MIHVSKLKNFILEPEFKFYDLYSLLYELLCTTQTTFTIALTLLSID